MENEEMVKLKIISIDDIWANFIDEDIEIPKKEYDKLNKIIGGGYESSWYFIYKDMIKFFNDKLQKWETINVKRDGNKFNYSFDYLNNTNKEIKVLQEIINKLNNN
jgi:hypothetical protein